LADDSGHKREEENIAHAHQLLNEIATDIIPQYERSLGRDNSVSSQQKKMAQTAVHKSQNFATLGLGSGLAAQNQVRKN